MEGAVVGVLVEEGRGVALFKTGVPVGVTPAGLNWQALSNNDKRRRIEVRR